MGVAPDELEEIQDSILEAGPAFYMAVAGRNDPMLSYLTTGFRDHARIRSLRNVKVTESMFKFFESIGIMNSSGALTDRAGDTAWMYLQYKKKKGDLREESLILQEGQKIIEGLQKKGLDIGHGHDGEFRAPKWLEAQLQEHYFKATRSVRESLDPNLLLGQGLRNSISLTTNAAEREQYLGKPALGETLIHESVMLLRNYRQAIPNPMTPMSEIEAVDLAVVISDGLNAKAVHKFAKSLHDRLQAQVQEHSLINLQDTVLLIKNARVRAGYVVGRELFSRTIKDSLDGVAAIVHIIGERPGNGHDSLSVYLTVARRSQWEKGVDHCHTKVVSGISPTALPLLDAAKETIRLLLEQARNQGAN
jgi:ethanolamine ammonia-lyase large subunit